MRTLLRAALMMLLCGLAFDFRASNVSGPSVIQYSFFFVAAIGGLCVIPVGLAMNRWGIVTGSRFGSRVLLITLGFCAWAPVALVASSDASHADFISVILPYLLYGLSMTAVLIALGNGVSERLIVRTMIAVSAISCAWRLVYAVTVDGVELATARWQILSPVLPLILGASVAALNTRTQRPLAMFGMVYFLGIVTLSITRGYLVGLAAVLVATVVTTRGRGSALLAPRVLGRMAVVLISIGVSLTVLMQVLPPEVSDRWTKRLTGEKSDSGGEITLLYRLAQFKGQYDELTQSGLTLVAGRGFGARFSFDEGLLSDLAFISPDESLESTNGSDSTWGYPIFAHGAVVGTSFLVAFLLVILRSLKQCRDSLVVGRDAFPQYFVCFSLMAVLGVSLTSNVLNERLGGVMLGALAALLIWSVRVIPRQNPVTPTAEAAPPDVIPMDAAERQNVDPNLSEHLLIIEPQAGGHRMHYVRYVVAAAISRGYRVTVATWAESAEHVSFKQIRTQHPGCGVLLMSRSGMSDAVLLRGGFPRQIAFHRMFDAFLRGLPAEQRPTHVFVPYLDMIDKVVAILGSPFGMVPWSGIVMRDTFHHEAMGIPGRRRRSDLVKQWLFLALLRDRRLTCLFTIDPSLPEWLHQRKPRSADRLAWLPEPVVMRGDATRAAVRLALGIPANSSVLLVYGVIDARKRLEAAIEALASPVCPHDVVLLIAGPQSKDTLALLSKGAGLKLISEGRIFQKNAYLSAHDEFEVFRASDFVWLGYRDHYTMSAVLIQAAAMGLPVIACAEGLIGWITQREALGVAVDVDDADLVGSSIRALCEQPEVVAQHAANGLVLAKSHHPERFAQRVLDTIFTEDAARAVIG